MRCETEVIIQPCTNEHAALTQYSASVASRMAPTASKSMPPVPPILATMPSNSSVVACESTFGPTILKAADAMANTMAAINATLNCPMKRTSLPMVPLKSCAFSPGIMRPIGPCPPRRRGDAAFSFAISSCWLIARHLLPALLPIAAKARFRDTARRYP